MRQRRADPLRGVLASIAVAWAKGTPMRRPPLAARCIHVSVSCVVATIF